LLQGHGWPFLLAGIALLGIIIFVHELGHFLAAKWRKVKVLRFSLGFGPPLVKVVRGDTEYRVSVIPLGGYVQMAGDSPGEDGTMPMGPDEFLAHPWPGRIAIALAGPLANLICAWAMLVTVFMVGVTSPDFPPRVGAVPDTSASFAAGLREGDRFTSVESKPVKSWWEALLGADDVPAGKPLHMTVAREGHEVAIVVPAARRAMFLRDLNQRRPPLEPIIGRVRVGMPAYNAGLKEGDRILAVDGKPIRSWEELPPAIRGHADRPARLTIVRGGRTFDLSVTPVGSSPGDRTGGQIGIEPPRQAVYVERHGLLESLDLGTRATLAMIKGVYAAMWQTVSHPLYYREYLGGPMFIVQAASQQAREGIDAYLQFLALISIAIMAFNLLPIPVLDGGHIFLALVQAVQRHPISVRVYMNYQRVGLVVIGALFILILANDPLRVVQRHRAIERAPQEKPIGPAGGR
jgi:regulator of sigma E protease